MTVVTMGDHSDDMLLLLNNIAWYCKEHKLTSEDLHQIFNAGLVARRQFIPEAA